MVSFVKRDTKVFVLLVMLDCLFQLCVHLSEGIRRGQAERKSVQFSAS